MDLSGALRASTIAKFVATIEHLLDKKATANHPNGFARCVRVPDFSGLPSWHDEFFTPEKDGAASFPKTMRWYNDERDRGNKTHPRYALMPFAKFLENYKKASCGEESGDFCILQIGYRSFRPRHPGRQPMYIQCTETMLLRVNRVYNRLKGRIQQFEGFLAIGDGSASQLLEKTEYHHYTLAFHIKLAFRTYLEKLVYVKSNQRPNHTENLKTFFLQVKTREALETPTTGSSTETVPFSSIFGIPGQIPLYPFTSEAAHHFPYPLYALSHGYSIIVDNDWPEGEAKIARLMFPRTLKFEGGKVSFDLQKERGRLLGPDVKKFAELLTEWERVRGIKIGSVPNFKRRKLGNRA
jgi:hypothetical protein